MWIKINWNRKNDIKGETFNKTVQEFNIRLHERTETEKAAKLEKKKKKVTTKEKSRSENEESENIVMWKNLVSLAFLRFQF